jgi:hypothetical protein
MAFLRILPASPKAAALAITASAIGCTAGILAIDAAFRGTLGLAHVAAFTSPHQAAATMIYMTKAARDELARLFVLGAMLGAAMLGAATWPRRGGTIGLPAVLLMAAVAQGVILAPQLAMPADLTGLTYCALRYVAPGVLWGWLLWRHGFVAALLGHTLTHPMLDPLLHALLQAR